MSAAHPLPTNNSRSAGMNRRGVIQEYLEKRERKVRMLPDSIRFLPADRLSVAQAKAGCEAPICKPCSPGGVRGEAFEAPPERKSHDAMNPRRGWSIDQPIRWADR
jgi:hypothetical protein